MKRPSGAKIEVAGFVKRQIHKMEKRIGNRWADR
jgi:hypothetical protein